MKYMVTLTAKFEIEAENAMQARNAARRIRSIGEALGARLLPNNRDWIRHKVTKVSEQLTWDKQ